MKPIYILVIIIVFGGIFIISSIEVSKRTKKDYKMFNKSDIKGVLLRGSSGSGIDRFYLKDDEKEYRFSPYTSELNDFEIFVHIAKVGDSIIKPAFSDTLILIHDGRILKYIFKKYE